MLIIVGSMEIISHTRENNVTTVVIKHKGHTVKYKTSREITNGVHEHMVNVAFDALVKSKTNARNNDNIKH